MQEITNTLLVPCIPAVITGVATYLIASRNAKTQTNNPAFKKR